MTWFTLCPSDTQKVPISPSLACSTGWRPSCVSADMRAPAARLRPAGPYTCISATCTLFPLAARSHEVTTQSCTYRACTGAKANASACCPSGL